MSPASVSRAVLVALLVSFPAAAAAQRVDTVIVRQPVAERSGVAAGVFEYLIPTVGHAYAGKWSRGVVPAAVRITGALMFLESMEDGDDDETLGSVGLLMALGGTVWSIWSAVDTAKGFNKGQLTRTSLIVTPADRGVGLGARIAF